jgi:hypothetical protein
MMGKAYHAYAVLQEQRRRFLPIRMPNKDFSPQLSIIFHRLFSSSEFYPGMVRVKEARDSSGTIGIRQKPLKTMQECFFRWLRLLTNIRHEKNIFIL